MSASIVIAGAARTPVGSFNGAFANIPAHEFGRGCHQGSARAWPASTPGDVDRGGNGPDPVGRRGTEPGPPGRPSRRLVRTRRPPGGSTSFAGRAFAPLPSACSRSRPAMPGSSSRVARNPCRWRRTARICVAARRWANLKFIDTMIKDGLTDAFFGYQHGQHGGAEKRRRAKWQLTREEQDAFAVASQNQGGSPRRRPAAFKDEIVPFTITGRKGDTIVSDDEYIRHGSTIEAMQKLRPAFDKEGHCPRRQRIGHQ